LQPYKGIETPFYKLHFALETLLLKEQRMKELRKAVLRTEVDLFADFVSSKEGMGT